MTDVFRSAPRLAPSDPAAIPLVPVLPDELGAALDGLSAPAAQWARANGFDAALGVALPLPGADGALEAVLLGLGSPEARARGRFHLAKAASTLPGGVYRLVPHSACDAELFALGWLLESYRFDRYRAQKPAEARLVCPEGAEAVRLHLLADAEYIARDLINTPAEDMGPNALTGAAEALAARHGAQIEVIEGEALLAQNLPLIHTVGRASDETPRLIDMRFGARGPRLTLVGKGVCFDTGGLNLKPGASMGLMKKDMGGAANVLALAHAIMGAGWEVQLRVLIPAVENNVSAGAFRPGDILRARNGLSVEINNTDAEGRLVLADALTLAAEERPDQIISMATLTGAARVALGPDIPPFYTGREALAGALSEAAQSAADPIWRMPFHDPYEALLEPGIADLDNAPKGGMAGSITAALFLRRFTDGCDYAHFDIYGWTPTAAPARPKGGAGQGWRALFAALPGVLGL